MRVLPWKGFDRLLSKQPDGFLSQASHRKIFAAIQQRSDGQRIGHVLGAIALRIKNSATIIVPEAFWRPRLRERLHYGKHSAQCSVILRWDFQSVLRSQHSCMKKEVERVNVVMQRLFEVNAIRTHLALRSLQHNFPPGLLPATRRRDLRIKRAEKEQRNRFTQQMSVGRKINRQVALDVASVKGQCGQQFRTKL